MAILPMGTGDYRPCPRPELNQRTRIWETTGRNLSSGSFVCAMSSSSARHCRATTLDRLVETPSDPSETRFGTPRPIVECLAHGGLVKLPDPKLFDRTANVENSHRQRCRVDDSIDGCLNPHRSWSNALWDATRRSREDAPCQVNELPKGALKLCSRVGECPV